MVASLPVKDALHPFQVPCLVAVAAHAGLVKARDDRLLPARVAPGMGGFQHFVGTTVHLHQFGLDREPAAYAPRRPSGRPINQPGYIALGALVGTLSIGQGCSADIGHPVDNEPRRRVQFASFRLPR